MSKLEKMLRAIRNNPANVRFNDACKAAEEIGFQLRGQSGSHRTYARSGEPMLLNFQDVKGKAKPYQVRQLIEMMDRYGG